MGKIEVICGSMFSGKSEELIRRMKRVSYAKTPSILFKIDVDTRYDKNDVATHSGDKMKAIPISYIGGVKQIKECLSQNPDVKVIGIDEITFFSHDIVEYINSLADDGYRVIVAGLDQDFLGRPFPIMSNLLALADDILKLHAICIDCGAEACKSHKKNTDNSLVQIGASELYEPLCRKCYNLKNNK